MRLFRELSRRRLRTTLTILGITIGIWALVVFASMANKINGYVASGSEYYLGKVIVSDASTGGIGVGVVPINLAVADEIRAMPGVAAADPQVEVPLEAVEFSGFGMPKIITGRVAGLDPGVERPSESRRRRAASSRQETRDRGSPCWARIWPASLASRWASPSTSGASRSRSSAFSSRP